MVQQLWRLLSSTFRLFFCVLRISLGARFDGKRKEVREEIFFCLNVVIVVE